MTEKQKFTNKLRLIEHKLLNICDSISDFIHEIYNDEDESDVRLNNKQLDHMVWAIDELNEFVYGVIEQKERGEDLEYNNIEIPPKTERAIQDLYHLIKDIKQYQS